MSIEDPISRYEICVGLNDGDARSQKYSKETYEKIIFNVCKGLEISYSISKIDGVYVHEDGTPIKEKSLCITLLGINDQQAEEIAKDFCVIFNQESVLVLKYECKYSFIKEKIITNTSDVS
ncbi:MAG: hypothetical protein Q4E88_01500 [Coriobacteriia bacterium]|nr:hypothetical protein [Coriobacteriia bacterium]